MGEIRRDVVKALFLRREDGQIGAEQRWILHRTHLDQHHPRQYRCPAEKMGPTVAKKLASYRVLKIRALKAQGEEKNNSYFS